jgi:hypothetical protein
MWMGAEWLFIAVVLCFWGKMVAGWSVQAEFVSDVSRQ